jgi:hypothetical protein
MRAQSKYEKMAEILDALKKLKEAAEVIEGYNTFESNLLTEVPETIIRFCENQYRIAVTVRKWETLVYEEMSDEG